MTQTSSPVDGLLPDDPWMLQVGSHTIRVAVRHGTSTRAPLLLMNGIGAPLETFEPLLDHLDPDLTVIRFDVPGVGRSPLPSRPYRLWSLASTVGRMLDVLGHDRVDVLGISWGGGLAQQFAVTERRRCRRLVLVATGTGSLMVPGSPRVLSRMITPRRYRDPNYMLSIAAELYGGSVREDPDRMAGLIKSFGGVPNGRGYLYQLLATAGWTSLPFLPLIGQPTLVLAGDDDPIIPAINGKVLARGIRNATLHVYHGGHIDLVANPGLLAPVIETFLTD